jgi:hypothetical protein
MKIRPLGAELFHADGRTDTTKLKVAFRNFAKAPKNYTVSLHIEILCFVWIPEETALISLTSIYLLYIKYNNIHDPQNTTLGKDVVHSYMFRLIKSSSGCKPRTL